MSASAKPGRAVSPRLRVAGSAGSGPIEGVRNGLGASWPACLRTQFSYNGDGVRTSKIVAGDTTQYVLDLAATLPVVISDTEAVYLYGLDIIAEHRFGRRVSVVALRDEQMALVASLYNAGMYSPIRHYSENKFGNYIMKNDLLGAWRRKLGIAPRYQLDLGRP